MFTISSRGGCSCALLCQLAHDLQHLGLPQQPVQGIHLLTPQGTEGAQLLQGTAKPGTSGTELTAHITASRLQQDPLQKDTYSPPQGVPCSLLLTSSRRLQLLR